MKVIFEKRSRVRNRFITPRSMRRSGSVPRVPIPILEFEDIDSESIITIEDWKDVLGHK